MLTTLPKWLRKPSDLLAGLQPATAAEVRCFLALSAIVVVTGVALRATSFSSWPTDFHLTRQYHGANVARRIWMGMTGVVDGSPEQTWLAGQTRSIIEPPIVETLVATGYALAGQELPWLGSLLTVTFWLIAAIFIFDTARRLSGGIFGGLLALTFYLMSPFGVVMSRSFQPESLMILAFSVAIWQAVRKPPLRTTSSAVAFGITAAVAILVKPGVLLFPLLAVLLIPSVVKDGLRATFTKSQTLIAGTLMVVPCLLYVAAFLTEQVDSKLIPQLLMSSEFYSAWLVQVERTVGWLPLLAAVAGACLLQGRDKECLGFSLLTGYIVYSMFFTWHTMTHNYYQALLIPIVAICMSPLAEIFRVGLKDVTLSRVVSLAGPLLMALVILRFGLPARKFVAPAKQQQQRQQIYAEIGEHVGKGNTVICLSEEYGLPLMHHSWLITHWWPTAVDMRHEQTRGASSRTPVERLDKLVQDHSPSHFVVTNLNEFKRQTELQDLLESRFQRSGNGKGWIVYQLSQAQPAKNSLVNKRRIP